MLRTLSIVHLLSQRDARPLVYHGPDSCAKYTPFPPNVMSESWNVLGRRVPGERYGQRQQPKPGNMSHPLQNPKPCLHLLCGWRWVRYGCPGAVRAVRTAVSERPPPGGGDGGMAVRVPGEGFLRRFRGVPTQQVRVWTVAPLVRWSFGIPTIKGPMLGHALVKSFGLRCV